MKVRTILSGVATAALTVAGLVTGPAATAATGCTAKYTVTGQWGSGFGAEVSFTNLGDRLTTWTLEFDFPAAGQRVNQGWSADWSQSGTHVTAKSLSWNSEVATKGSVGLGFNGSWSDANPVPASISVNGVKCDGTIIDPPKTPAPQLHVQGNKIVTAKGEPYRLLGVDRSSGEFACVQGKGMWDGGPVDQTSVNAMKTWNIHALRIPLNEECWLGTNGSPSGAAYQQQVKDYVNLLVANGITPILDLHWTWGEFTGVDWACKDVTATCQKPIPSARNAPRFWTGVANAFKGNNAVVFDLFNEPWPEFGTVDREAGWRCLRDGGTCAGFSYEVAGMQSMLDAVRSTGATNIVMVGGLEWTNDLREWTQYKPHDPTGNLVASWHSYSFNRCAAVDCWNTEIAPLAAQVPVVIGEMGADNCGYDYVDALTKWADTHGLSYLAWTWNPWGCTQGGVLIKDWNGTPEPGIGEGYKAHLLTQDPYA